MKIIHGFISLLVEDERYVWFQQDGATAHTAEKTMDILAKFFEYTIISKGRWLAKSPDHTPPGFFLWAYFKNNVYRNKSRSVEELKMEEEVQIRATDKNTCKPIFENIIRW